MTLSQKRPRKRKVPAPESKDQDDKESASKKPKSQPVSKPNSIIVEQLTNSDSGVVSSALASLASAEEDKVEEFLAGGGNAGHILHSLDSAEGKVKANEVAAVFNAIDALVGHIVRNPESDRAGVASQVVKRVLSDYDKEMVLLISGTNTAYQAKSVLRMLTSFVMLGPDQAREVLIKVNWTHDNWDTLYKRTSKKETPDVRTCFIHFLLSFLMEPSPMVIKEYLGQKTRLVNIFSGMMHDSPETIIMILDTLKSKILENQVVNKTMKMRLFGSNTIKQILSLLKWNGGTKDDIADVDEDIKDSIKEAVLAFIKTLLGSKRYGVIFPDPAVGQLENNNNLVREVITSLGASKPWEDVSLSSIIVDLITACPDQLPAVLQMLEKSWEVRDSSTWHQIIDLIISITEKLDITSISDNIPSNNSLIEKIVHNIVAPAKLMNKVIIPGLKMADQEAVWCKCCHLLALIASNLDKFLAGFQKSKRSQYQTAMSSCVAVMRKYVDISTLWNNVMVLLTNSNIKAVINILDIVRFRFKIIGFDGAEIVNMGQILQQVSNISEEGKADATGIQLKLLELINFSTQTRNKTLMPALGSILNEQTMQMLLEIIVTSDGDQKKTALETFTGLVRSADICLKSEADLEIILALVNKKNSREITKYIVEAYSKKKELNIKVQEMKFIEVWQVRNKSPQKIEDLFEDLLEEKDNGSTKLTDSQTQFFSPLVLAFLQNQTPITKNLLTRMVFLFNESEIFLRTLKLAKDSDGGRVLVGKDVDLPVTDSKFDVRLELLKNKTMLKTALNQILQNCTDESISSLDDVVKIIPEEELGLVLEHTVSNITFKNEFNPNHSNSYNKCVMRILKHSARASVNLGPLTENFQRTVCLILKDVSTDIIQDQKMLEEAFTFLPLSTTLLLEAFELLVQISTQKLSSNPTLLTVLAGLMFSLAFNKASIEKSLFAKILCIIEVLLGPDTSDQMTKIVQHLTSYLSSTKDAAALVGSNLITVLLKDPNESNLKLLETILTLEKKHFEAVKTWICHEKQHLSHKVWPLVKLIIQDRDQHVEKKFVTIVLRHVMGQVEEGGESPELVEMVELLASLARVSRTDKQTELWVRAAGDKRDLARCLEADTPGVTRIRAEVLVTIQEMSGGQDTRLMRECLLPLMSHIARSIKTEPELATALCETINRCQEKIENKVFLKEFQKVSSTVWPQFYRNVLKYSLKPGTISTAPVGPLNMLADICQFLINGTLYEMLTNHSSYLEVMAGPGSTLKTATVSLLLALCPVSCNLDQVPVLLSAYTATLHPSDRALLTLLQRHETLAGLDLSPFQPLVWGQQAAQHYSSASSGQGWRQAKCSEILGFLDPVMVRRTCNKFPLLLQLDPEAESSEEIVQASELYDPRFLLPVFSHLLSPDVYIDKHIKFIEVGALNLALCSLSSKDRDVRSAGYHVLARLRSALEAAKLSQEKQVWLHVISILRLGVVSNSLTRAGRVSSIITQYLSRCVDVLLTPMSPLYKTVTKSLLAKPILELSSIPEFQRLVIGDKTELRWLLESVGAGLRDSRDYGLGVRSNMVKILTGMLEGVTTDRAGSLLILDIIEAAVTTNYGCVDLATRHGLLTWCECVLTRERLDIALVRKLLAITRRMVETCTRIDERKLRTTDTSDTEGTESRRLLLPTLQVPFTTLLSKFSLIADARVQSEMKSEVENLQRLLLPKS